MSKRKGIEEQIHSYEKELKKLKTELRHPPKRNTFIQKYAKKSSNVRVMTTESLPYLRSSSHTPLFLVQVIGTRWGIMDDENIIEEVNLVEISGDGLCIISRENPSLRVENASLRKPLNRTCAM